MKIEAFLHGHKKTLIGHIEPRSPDGGRPHNRPDKGVASILPYDFLTKDLAFPIVSMWTVVRIVARYVTGPANVHGGGKHYSLDTRYAAGCLDEVFHSNRVDLVVVYASPLEVSPSSQMEDIFRMEVPNSFLKLRCIE